MGLGSCRLPAPEGGVLVPVPQIPKRVEIYCVAWFPLEDTERRFARPMVR